MHQSKKLTYELFFESASPAIIKGEVYEGVELIASWMNSSTRGGWVSAVRPVSPVIFSISGICWVGWVKSERKEGLPSEIVKRLKHNF